MLITLFVPDLNALCADTAMERRWPALETLFARSHMQPAQDINGILSDIFGLTEEFAVAPFMHLADTGERDAEFYFRADPVHLAPDRDQLVMLPLSVLQVQMEEARALAETFNRTYGAEGYRLETPYPERWYLRVPMPLRCVTHEPAKVAGGSVFECMPQGEDGRRLRQFMNEVQMLFFEHPLNQAREMSGKPAINSLWFWGGGRLPETPITGPDRVWSDISLVTGLARFAGSDCLAWPGRLDITSESGKQLIAINCTTDEELTQLEKQVAVPLLRALRQTQIRELLIYPGNRKSYRITFALLKRFWRLRRPLPDILRAP